MRRESLSWLSDSVFQFVIHFNAIWVNPESTERQLSKSLSGPNDSLIQTLIHSKKKKTTPKWILVIANWFRFKDDQQNKREAIWVMTKWVNDLNTNLFGARSESLSCLSDSVIRFPTHCNTIWVNPVHEQMIHFLKHISTERQISKSLLWFIDSNTDSLNDTKAQNYSLIQRLVHWKKNKVNLGNNQMFQIEKYPTEYKRSKSESRSNDSLIQIHNCLKQLD